MKTSNTDEARDKQIRSDRIANMESQKHASEMIEAWHSRGAISDAEYHKLVKLNNG